MKVIIFLLVAFSLAACTTPPTHKFVADPEEKWQQRKLELSAINDWLLSGRIAIINGDESWHLNMKWQRHGDKYILDLSGPFGAGHAQLTGTGDKVILLDSDKQLFYAESPDQLLQEVTGLRIPVKSLLYWIRGIPDGDVNQGSQNIDQFGRLSLLKQNDWRIRYKNYIEVDQYELPQKIFMDGIDIKVKIFIEKWDLKTTSFQSNKNN